ncbi:probable protein phosphatase 2C 24 [Camellia sinensis]|uniref:probable protein phosphatase 2C 24 n=1 Tax=Camellia sinensis TaxID=4442 RepID=UPI00103628C1|nr:probable protein phosphatase 2C 24 [Camellia sinensis]
MVLESRRLIKRYDISYAFFKAWCLLMVAMKCRDWLHELGKEEIKKKDSSTEEWKIAIERSFNRMDNEVIAWNDSVLHADCRCELQTPECNTVGSTAVVAVVTPDKIIVANCGDSRAVLCHNDEAILSQPITRLALVDCP